MRPAWPISWPAGWRPEVSDEAIFLAVVAGSASGAGLVRTEPRCRIAAAANSRSERAHSRFTPRCWRRWRLRRRWASLETLARWTGLEADYRLKQLLWEEWAPFLFRSDDRFRLYHASLRDFLSGEMTAEDLIPADKALVTEMAERTRGSHRRIATCYLTDSTRWADHNGYALRHLAQAGMFAELGNLIENRAWYEAQRNYDPSLDAYAADVVQSLALAERRGMDGLPQVVAWSLLYATVRMRSIVLEQIAESLAQLGDLERALNITESIWTWSTTSHRQATGRQPVACKRHLPWCAPRAGMKCCSTLMRLRRHWRNWALSMPRVNID